MSRTSINVAFSLHRAFCARIMFAGMHNGTQFFIFQFCNMTLHMSRLCKRKVIIIFFVFRKNIKREFWMQKPRKYMKRKRKFKSFIIEAGIDRAHKSFGSMSRYASTIWTMKGHIDQFLFLSFFQSSKLHH